MGGTDIAVTPDPAPVEVAGPTGLDEESIGVALSGGGVRAALFSLGVLTGLVDCGKNGHVRHLSSVSGGSIVNAAIAQSCRYKDVSSDDFRDVAKPIATRLCRRGMFVFSGAAVWGLVKAIAKAFTGILVAAIAASSILAGAASAVSGASWFSLQWGISAGAATSLLSLFFARGWLQEGIYASFLADVKREVTERKAAAAAQKMGVEEPTVQEPAVQEAEADRPARKGSEATREDETTHVIVATDLVSGQPVYFSRDFVYCPAFGWGDPGTMRPASQIQASAAFPFVFPVRWFLRRPFRFQNGMSQPPFPRWLKLTDGGVYNNLGTDWFDVVDRENRPDIWELGNPELCPALVPVDKQIVVNAGAASRGLRKVRPFLAISRTMNVLYDNTVRPRLAGLLDAPRKGERASAVIDISESPYEIAHRLAEVDANSPADIHDDGAAERQARAQELERLLSRRQEPYWIEFARQTSHTKTKLSSAGLEAGARVMLHGYLSTIVMMYVRYDAPLPDSLKDEGYFLDLAGRRASGSLPGTEPSAAPLPAAHTDRSG